MMRWLKYRLFRIREIIRMSPPVSISLYMAQNIQAAFKGRLLPLNSAKSNNPNGAALCLRFRDESRYLDEWIRYHRMAGIEHFFLYNNFSADNFAAVLAPHLKAGYVTLIDWPRKPASPAAEEDCIARAIGRFRWVGFLDADEFVVIKDGRSIPEYLSAFHKAPAVALHWYYFGSNGHESRPNLPVIQAYIRRQSRPNRHVKCFVRPDCVSQNRNSHSWFFRKAAWAVDESGKGVFGSIGTPRGEYAWINHYYFKSLEDYLEKARQKSTLDSFGLQYNTRLADKARGAMCESNDEEDRSAMVYFQTRANLASERM